MPVSPSLERVRSGDLCSGCGLCAGISGGAVKMEFAATGFARPVQNAPLGSGAEAIVAECCPGLVVAPWPDNGEGDPLWGPSQWLGVGHSCDEELRFAGASGGTLAALLCHALSTGLVDSVLHVEPDSVNPLGNRMRWSTSRDEVLQGSGSRYAPSSPLEFIDIALDSGRIFAFVGKPCDVSALRLLAKTDQRVARNIPLVLSFYCGGVPSLRGAERVVRALGLSVEQVVRFRYRGQGWPGSAVAETDRGEEHSMTYSESWGEHLSREVQFRCKICPDAVGASADIACADAWIGDEDGYPVFEEEDGRSLIHARTERGEAFLASAIAAGVLSVEPVQSSAINLMQPFQARRKRAIRSRSTACRLILRPVPEMRGTGVEVASRQASLWEKARAFFGTMRRLRREERAA